MPPPLAAVDRQVTWQPTWVLECAEFPHVYAIRDISVPGIGGGAFGTGESDTGGLDLVGGGAGPDALHAWGRIIGSPTVTRRISDPLWPMVEIQDVTVTIADPDGDLTGDFRAAPFTLSRYDAVSGVRLYEWTGLIDHTSRDREAVTITGTTVDAAWLEERVPAGTIDSVTFPYADPSALGQTPPWVFGNVRDMTLPNVADNQVDSEYDYLLSAGDVAALLALRRVARDPATTPAFDITIDELEPYPGEDGVLVNGTLEDWDAGAAVAPTGWVLTGAGATIAKDTTNMVEGNACAAVTRVGANTFLTQNLVANAPTLDLAWWRGREISVVASVDSSVAVTVRMRVDDGVTIYDSAFHTGGGLPEDLVVGTVGVPCVLDAAATKCDVQLRIITTNQTVSLDNVRVFLRATSWEEIPRPDLYDGYTAIRFFLRQEDASGSLYPIVADLNGMQPERNPVRAARTLLSDATHGAGRTVDATTFAQAEIDACLTLEDVFRLDDAVLLLPFRDPVPDKTVASVPTRDRSGRDNNGTIFNGGGGIPLAFGGPSSDELTPNLGVFSNYDDASLALPAAGTVGTYASVPSRRAYSGQTITVECWVQIYAGNLPDAGTYPLIEKLVGTTSLSGYGLYRTGNNLRFFVRGTDAVLYTADSALIDGVDEGRWIHVVGRAFSNVLHLYRDGVGAASGTYSSTIAEGDGEVLIGRFGGGVGNPGRDWIDNVVLYATTLSVARIVAHAAAATPPAAEPAVTYHHSSALASSEFHYLLSEPAGSAVMNDASGNGHQGAFVGTPLLAVPGPLTAERGYTNGWGGMRLANNVAQYAVETGMTLADAAGAVACFYAPAAKRVNAGILEKTIGGVRATQWGLCQRVGTVGIGLIRFTLVTSGGTFIVDAPLLNEDRHRYMHLGATWGSGTIELYKNFTLAASTTYTGTPASGVGDFYVGIQGTAGAGLTRPGQGDIAQVSYAPVHWGEATVAHLGTLATWYNGGLCVDVALREARQAQDWISQFALLADLRLGATTTGAITAAVGLANPATVQLAARDGAGDGERNLVSISGRATPSLADTVRDLVLRYRPDLQTGEWLRTLRREVSTRLDGQGRRIGKKKVLTLDCVREDPTADRVLDRLRKRMKAADDQVQVTLHQEARRLMEGHLVQIEEAHMGYAGEVLEVRKVGKALDTIAADLVGWDESALTYEPSAFPPGATSG